MSFYQTYIQNQATLILNNYTNNSQNHVFEIVRGKNIYSRYIFSLDLTDLRNTFTNNNIPSGVTTTHTLNFYNAIKYRPDLIGRNTVDGLTRDSNFTLQLFSFDEDFTNGIYFDYIYNTGLTYTTFTETTQVPNWYYKDSLNTWNIPGVYSGNTANILGTQSLQQGNENLQFDISDYINNILYTTTGNTVNLGIAYQGAYETGYTGTNVYTTSFFSKYTQSFYEPYLASAIDDFINDNRKCFYLDENNNLYLYLNKTIDSVDYVNIYDDNGALFQTFSGSSLNYLNNQVYYVTLSVPSSTYPDMVNFQDIWYYTDNGIQKNYTQNFTLLTRNIFNSETDAFQNSIFDISTVGLLYNEKLSQPYGTKRVQVTTKRLFNSSIELEFPNEYLEYRLYVLQGENEIEIIPYTSVNRTFYNNYFDLDIDSLIPQIYYVDIRINRNNIILSNKKSIKFVVVGSEITS